MKTQRLVVNQKNNKIYRIPNHFPMGICISIEFILKSKLELARISRNIQDYSNIKILPVNKIFF